MECTEAIWPWLRRFATPVVTALAPSAGYGLDRVPLEGGLVIAANHLSAIDHPLLAAMSPRPVHFMAKAELMAVPIVGRALAVTGAFPVRRGEADRAALRRACEIAANGGVVGVHLEGTRQRDGRPGEFKGGALFVALHAAVPVVPAGIASFGWSMRSRAACAVVFGEPIDLAGIRANRTGIAEATRLVGQAVVELWREAVDAVEAGFPAMTADGARRAGAVPASWRVGEPFPDPRAAR